MANEECPADTDRALPTTATLYLDLIAGITAKPITDAHSGEHAGAVQHNGWVLLGHGPGEPDLWLTPTDARRLAAQLLNAADDAEMTR
jgi:hypothetical protein